MSAIKNRKFRRRADPGDCMECRGAKRFIAVFRLDQKHLIKIEFSGENVPYSAAGGDYLRTADEDREVSPTERRIFFSAYKYRELWEKGKSDASATKIDRSAKKAFWQRAVAAGRLPAVHYICRLF